MILNHDRLVAFGQAHGRHGAPELRRDGPDILVRCSGCHAELTLECQNPMELAEFLDGLVLQASTPRAGIH